MGSVEHAPPPGAESKPDSPVELTKPSWTYTLRRALHEFGKDEVTDLAAALTYYSVLAIFPAAIALASILSLVGQGQQTVDTLTDIVGDVAGSGAADGVRPVIEQISQTPGAGLALALGLAGALWSASGYVRSFGRSMNRIYNTPEGRPGWKLRLYMLAVTAGLIVLAALVLLGLVVTGPVAEAIGNAVGLGSAAVTAWNVAKWPVLAVVVVVMVAVLYYATPNIRQPKFRWLSVGAVAAIIVWVLASVGFAFYVGNFASYNKTYGTLAGIVVFLLWLWITNLALLAGAEIDAEMERARELQAGIAAERDVQLPARDTRGIDKSERKLREDVARGAELRRNAGE